MAGVGHRSDSGTFKQCCILKIPYGTITASLMATCGLVISTLALMHSTSITHRIFYELLHRNLLWFNDLKVVLVIFAAIIGVIIMVNVMVGFATTGKGDEMRSSGCRCCCTRGSATSCVVKFVFAINYIIYYIVFIITMSLVIGLFVCYIMSRLCNDGRYATVSTHETGFVQPNINPAENEQQIDLRQFSPLIGLRSNETNLLLFKDYRLKKLCIDYMGSLNFYVILGSIGYCLMCIGFMNYLINLSINWVRISTKQKYAELIYINGAEMTAFCEPDSIDDRRY
ncbi:hypothetical protein HDE_09908 [Halotydeus destructor]|nr:hypothetical protein HDE_09908 [Halotydeus destructor]